VTTVLIAGHVTLDHYGAELLPGGGAYYAGRAYAELGAEVRIATAASLDFPPDALRGMEASVSPAPRTTTFTNAYQPDGARVQRVEAMAPPLDPARLPAGWLGADLVHLAPVVAELELGAWLRAARARFVGLGVQGWVRAVEPDGTVSQPTWEVSPADLAGVSAACVGEDDLVGQGDLVDRLAAAVPVVAFTHGERGCELLLSGRTVRVGAYRTRAVDPTGAGDVFSAAFFLALAEGRDPADAARHGAAAASIVVEGRAGEALPRLGEARARAAGVPVLGDGAGRPRG
jgi:1D-myo-inositol 3-kinase